MNDMTSKHSTSYTNNIFYFFKPLIPRRLQLGMRNILIRCRRSSYKDIWPINEKAFNPPRNWSGWPEQKKFALILTHDVDTAKGHKNCLNLLELERKLGFRSSFNFVPERYNVSPKLRDHLVSNGFEVGVHGLRHDGKLYKSRNIFLDKAAKINAYLKAWDAVGFRSPSMHHNLDWLHALNIDYDSSTFDTDPFEPQSDSICSIFPLWIAGHSNQKGYIELPYTLPQDSTLFLFMNEPNIEIWKNKLDWLAEHGGMALLNTHPDYMNFDSNKSSFDEYPANYYEQLLLYIKKRYAGQYWHVLPKDMAHFWKQTMV